MSRGPLVVLVLAAGQGKRMASDLAKVLHPVAGRGLLLHVLEAARPLNADRTLVVVGHQRDQVIRALEGSGAEIVVQAEQLGTGHAVMMAGPALQGFQGTLLVLCGDTPLLGTATLRALLAENATSGASATVLSARVPDPKGYGRIVRDGNGDLLAIVEDRDATEAQRAIDEINSGMYVFDYAALLGTLGRLGRGNAQSEYYLTDSIAILRGAGRRVRAYCAPNYREVLGVNTMDQLYQAEALFVTLEKTVGFRGDVR